MSTTYPISAIAGVLLAEARKNIAEGISRVDLQTKSLGRAIENVTEAPAAIGDYEGLLVPEIGAETEREVRGRSKCATIDCRAHWPDSVVG